MEYRLETSDKTCELFILGDLKFGDHKIVDVVTSVLDDDAVDQLVLNMSELDKLDSYGIGILLKSNQLAADRGKSLALRNINDSISEIFTMFNLREELTVLDHWRRQAGLTMAAFSQFVFNPVPADNKR